MSGRAPTAGPGGLPGCVMIALDLPGHQHWSAGTMAKKKRKARARKKNKANHGKRPNA